MTKVPTSLEIVFENCDIAVIPFEYVSDVTLCDISTTKSFTKDHSGQWRDITFRKALSAHVLFKKDFDTCLLTTWFDDVIRHRLLKHQDITYINYLFPGERIETAIDWGVSDGCDNQNQRCSNDFFSGALRININEAPRQESH